MFKNIHDLLLKDQLPEARHALFQINRSNLSLAEKLQYSETARRIGLAHLGLRTLYPHIRTENAQPGEKELLEYAACLIELGAHYEASQILSNVDREKHPETHYLEAVLCIQKREHNREAGRALERYLASAKTESFQTQEAKHFLFNIRAEESLSEVVPQFAEWEKTIHLLPPTRHLALRKWRTVSKLHDNPANPKLIQELRNLRSEAVEREQWEEVRDLDRFEAVFTKNEKLFLNVYFGSPFVEFRNSFVKEYRLPVSLPRFFDWSVPSVNQTPSEKGKMVFDLLMGERAGGKTPIKVGKGMHRLFMLFASDFYRPFRIAQLFCQLYPGELYEPTHSPPRVHQILNRLRVWFSKNHLPLVVEEQEHLYRLFAQESFVIRVPHVQTSADPALVHLEKLKELFGTRPFSAIEAGNALKVSGRTILRLMEKGAQAHLVQRNGKGAATRYQFIHEDQVARRAA